MYKGTLFNILFGRNRMNDHFIPVVVSATLVSYFLVEAVLLEKAQDASLAKLLDL